LKILGLPYTLYNTNLPITSQIIEKVIKESYISPNLTWQWFGLTIGTHRMGPRPRALTNNSMSDDLLLWYMAQI